MLKICSFSPPSHLPPSYSLPYEIDGGFAKLRLGHFFTLYAVGPLLADMLQRYDKKEIKQNKILAGDKSCPGWETGTWSSITTEMRRSAVACRLCSHLVMSPGHQCKLPNQKPFPSSLCSQSGTLLSWQGGMTKWNVLSAFMLISSGGGLMINLMQLPSLSLQCCLTTFIPLIF